MTDDGSDAGLHSPGSDPDIINRLQQLAALRASGDLSDEEFEIAKRKALGVPPASVSAPPSKRFRHKKRWLAIGAGVLAAAVATAAVAVLVTRPADKPQLAVEGKFTLSNGSYDASSSYSDPNYKGDGAGGCQGTSGYGDLNSITQVVVTNDQGDEVARTQLGQGDTQGSNDSKYGNCVFTFNVVVEQGAKYYVVSVGDRGSSQYTYEELESPGAIALIIGNE